MLSPHIRIGVISTVLSGMGRRIRVVQVRRPAFFGADDAFTGEASQGWLSGCSAPEHPCFSFSFLPLRHREI